MQKSTSSQQNVSQGHWDMSRVKSNTLSWKVSNWDEGLKFPLLNLHNYILYAKGIYTRDGNTWRRDNEDSEWVSHEKTSHNVGHLSEYVHIQNRFYVLPIQSMKPLGRVEDYLDKVYWEM